jgi:hypothetical protein
MRVAQLVKEIPVIIETDGFMIAFLRVPYLS